MCNHPTQRLHKRLHSLHDCTTWHSASKGTTMSITHRLRKPGTTEPLPRRPGLAKLAAEIQRKNPSWNPQRCVVEAKHQLTRGATVAAPERGAA